MKRLLVSYYALFSKYVSYSALLSYFYSYALFSKNVTKSKNNILIQSLNTVYTYKKIMKENLARFGYLHLKNK